MYGCTFCVYIIDRYITHFVSCKTCYVDVAENFRSHGITVARTAEARQVSSMTSTSGLGLCQHRSVVSSQRAMRVAARSPNEGRNDLSLALHIFTLYNSKYI